MLHEVQYGLDIDTSAHLWLLHALFLPRINAELQFFSESWNEHKLQIRGGPNRSPADLFGFDMAVYGLRGDTDTIEDHTLSPEELEV